MRTLCVYLHGLDFDRVMAEARRDGASGGFHSTALGLLGKSCRAWGATKSEEVTYDTPGNDAISVE